MMLAMSLRDVVQYFRLSSGLTLFQDEIVHSTNARCLWQSVREPVIARYRGYDILRLFRGDAGFSLLMGGRVEMEPDVLVLLRFWREEQSFMKTYGKFRLRKETQNESR